MLLQSVALLFAPLALAALEVTAPGKDIWWVNDSQNVIAWKGDAPPADFVPYLSNPDIKLLTADTALAPITQTYMSSVGLAKGTYNVGTGYVIKLTNPINVTDVYATSQPFEIKPLGSAYPASATTSAASTVSAAPSGASGSAAASQSAKPGGSAISNAVPVVAAAAAGAVAYVMV